MEIKLTTFAKVVNSREWPQMLAEYAAESANPDLGIADPSAEIYEQLERAGLLQVIAAYQDGTLIGFCGVMLSPMPHYGGQLAALVESVFVSKNKRKTGAGLRLIAAVEDYARSKVINIVMFTCPIGGQLEQVLRKKKFNAHNIFFTKRLA